MASSRPRKKLITAPKEAGNGSYREARRGEAGEMYRALAEELDGTGAGPADPGHDGAEGSGSG